MSILAALVARDTTVLAEYGPVGTFLSFYVFLFSHSSHFAPLHTTICSFALKIKSITSRRLAEDCCSKFQQDTITKSPILMKGDFFNQ